MKRKDANNWKIEERKNFRNYKLLSITLKGCWPSLTRASKVLKRTQNDLQRPRRGNLDAGKVEGDEKKTIAKVQKKRRRNILGSEKERNNKGKPIEWMEK
jgi:hypothetical protein